MIQHPMHPAIRALEETLVSVRNCRNRALQPSNGGSFNQSFYSKPPQTSSQKSLTASAQNHATPARMMLMSGAPV